ncbi:Chitinase 2 [Linderina pennispora]|nr:Chitinase 2 [Linderina pennispora]
MFARHIITLCTALFSQALAFSPSSNSNFVVYWGQNSGGSQQSLGDYCRDSTVDVIALSFLYQFPNTALNFANGCETKFEGSDLLHCPNMASDIKYCQSQGKIVVLSMGGATGAYGFSSDAEGSSYANTVWNMFLGGSADKRPFDDAVLDGVDLDIEGGATAGYPAFINQLRSHFSGKQYYITGAPQCPFPDAMLGSTLNSAWFDMVFVQFYNNFCGLDAYPQGFNYDAWDNWAKTQSVNKNVKIYIGAPGSQSAAGRGFVDAGTLNRIVNDIKQKYTSLGGVMTWDASQALSSSNWGKSVSANLKSGGGAPVRRKRTISTGHQIMTRAANMTSSGTETPVRIEVVQGKDTDRFGFSVKIRALDAPMGKNWELKMPLPDGARISDAHAPGFDTSVQDGHLVVRSDSDNKAIADQNMSIHLHVAGKLDSGMSRRFALPDPAKASLLFK